MYKITYNNGYRTWEGLSNSLAIVLNCISLVPAKSFYDGEYVFSNELDEKIFVNPDYIYTIEKLT